MEVYNQIKRDISFLCFLFFIVYVIVGIFNIGIDDTDKDGFNRSGFKLMTDYGTGKQYLYKNGYFIERNK